MGLATFLSWVAKLTKSSSLHWYDLYSSKPASLTALAIWDLLIPSPVIFCSKCLLIGSLAVCAVLLMVLQSLWINALSQRSNSCSNILMSSMGSFVRGSTGCPWRFVAPDASATTMRASALLTSSRNWLPNPLPWCAPGMRPGVSMRSTGMSLVPSTHALFWGSS